MSAPEPATQFTNLANLVLLLLTPMFLWSTDGDIRLAYTAAAQTVNEYRIANRLSFFTVAKIIAFDIATLSSLSQSMYEDVSILLALRLRGNANSLDRSAERNRRKLELEQASRPGASTKAAEEPVEAAIAKAEQMVREAKARIQAAKTPAAKAQPGAEQAAVAAPVPDSASGARTDEEKHRGGAMTSVAEESAAGLNDLPPEERWKEMARIKAATTAASDPVSGTFPPPIGAMLARSSDGDTPNYTNGRYERLAGT